MGSANTPVTRQQFEAAKEHRIHFGRHKGKSYNQIAETNEGLLYLDWLIRQDWFGAEEGEYAENNRERAQQLAIFLGYPPVSRDVEEAIRLKRQEARDRRAGAKHHREDEQG